MHRGMWNLPRSGLEPMSPVLAGGFFTTGPPGKFPTSSCSTFPYSPLVAKTVNNPLATWETWVRFLGWEDPLEKRMATYSSILTRRITWTEEPGRLQSMGSQRVGHN